ncbi:acylneuraminate cytidylyltransferase family protein [Hydrogenimonas sp.]
MNVAALLTGRGNNTLKDKNVLQINGKPLLAYPATAAKHVSLIDHFYVSSDDKKILDAAAKLGYEKIIRPAELATPTAKHIDAIYHALDVMKEKDGYVPDILIVFLANSATVKSDWIEEGIKEIMANPKISAVVPVFQDQDHHPYRAKRLREDGMLDTFFDFGDREISTNRQELEPCFFLCHNFWILNVEKSIYGEGGQKPWTFLGDNIKPIVVEECFDVHDLHDIERTKRWLEKNGIG